MSNPAIIQSIDVSRKFGKITAVENLSLSIYQGEILGLLGPNGAGKSTTINMLCGLLKPSSGTILIEGKPIATSEKVFSKVGLCPQENILWLKLTCLEQLVFMGTMYGMSHGIALDHSKQLLTSMGLLDRRNSLAQSLSGGMKKRLNLALALVHDPDILVLDEPEAGLDPQSRILVREFIKSMAVRKTVILTTHNMDEADRLADRIAIIDHGKLLVTGTPDELKKLSGETELLCIQLTPEAESRISELIPFLEKLAGTIQLADSELRFRSPGIIAKTSEIIAILKKFNLPYGEIQLRNATLEDVFIKLTGRKLRE